MMNFQKGFQRLLLVSLVPVGLSLYQNFDLAQASLFFIMYFVIGLQLTYLKRGVLIALLTSATAMSAFFNYFLGTTFPLFMLATLIFVALSVFIFWIYMGFRWVAKGFY